MSSGDSLAARNVRIEDLLHGKFSSIGKFAMIYLAGLSPASPRFRSPKGPSHSPSEKQQLCLSPLERPARQKASTQFAANLCEIIGSYLVRHS